MNNNNQTKNFVFYSNKCKYCNLLKDEMINCGLLSTFIFYCVDGNNSILNYVKTVPTMVLEGISTPLVKDAAFKWIENFKAAKRLNKFHDTNYLINSVNEENKFTTTDEPDSNGFTSVEGNDKTNLFLTKNIDQTFIPAVQKIEKIPKHILTDRLKYVSLNRKNQEEVAGIINKNYIGKATGGKF